MSLPALRTMTTSETCLRHKLDYFSRKKPGLVLLVMQLVPIGHCILASRLVLRARVLRTVVARGARRACRRRSAPSSPEAVEEKQMRVPAFDDVDRDHETPRT